jgi:RNA polymerase sigma factor (sigma-70 family)
MSGSSIPRRLPKGVASLGGQAGSADDVEIQFTAFVLEQEPRLRRAFVAAYGSHRGREATAEALAFAWEYWDRLSKVNNVPGYLYRVGQSRTRHRRNEPSFVLERHEEPIFEPDLVPALKTLTVRQRTAVVLVYGFGWTLREVADLTGTKITTVQNHLERGLTKLRRILEGDPT